MTAIYDMNEWYFWFELCMGSKTEGHPLQIFCTGDLLYKR